MRPLPQDVDVLRLGFFFLAGLIAIFASTSFNLNLGPAGLLLLPVFALPLIHLFVSTSRLRRAAESGSVEPPAPGCFPAIVPTDGESPRP